MKFLIAYTFFILFSGTAQAIELTPQVAPTTMGKFGPTNFYIIQNEISKNPGTLLEVLTDSYNQILHGHASPYKIRINYNGQLPPGEIAKYSLIEGVTGKPTLLLSVHPLVRDNPFVMLEAITTLDVYHTIISNIIAYDQKSITPKVVKLNDQLKLTTAKGETNNESLLKLHFPDVLTVAEMQANADAGSPFAKRKVAELKSMAYQFFTANVKTFSGIENLDEGNKIRALQEYAALKGVKSSSSRNYDQALADTLGSIDAKSKNELHNLTVAAKKAYTQQRAQYSMEADIREQVSQSESLGEMLKANNREGVALAMEKMFPWSLMEPTEKVFWRNYIEAIRHPNYQDAPILFRGIDAAEKFQSVTDVKGNIIGGGMLSKRLTAGSGSHFFKLKGLPETFESAGIQQSGIPYVRVSPVTTPHTLSAMMTNHAKNAVGSLFISLTSSLSVAWKFNTSAEIKVAHIDQAKAAIKKAANTNASGGIATVRIDRRRLLTNKSSGYATELEILASLLIFPDEVLYLEKGTSYFVTDLSTGKQSQEVRLDINEYYQRARSMVYQKTNVILPETHEAYAKSSVEAFHSGYNDLAKIMASTSVSSPLSCSKVFQ